jgi:hypothetical protein
LKLGTGHRKDSLHTVGRNRVESTDSAAHSAVEEKQKVQMRVPRDESQVSVGGLLALDYGRKKILQKKR